MYQSRKILIVDDEKPYVMLYYLKKEGFYR